MNSAEIREKFLQFFASKGHTIVRSGSLVPQQDPTLLFTNAGMNQFKDVFLGFDQRPYRRATTAQKCVRAGGKHNDLENVGYTARHHTFFEMLGNFSFGDYFKRDAIHYAWELLVQVYGLPAEKLWVTVYADDDEAYAIWAQEIGIPPERLVRIGDNKGAPFASDNFWMMGETGPCGPCTEIFYDHGADIAGGPPGSPDEDGDRYIEIWNNVFMQFNRDEAGVMHPLPAPSVDTGMGLERIAAVLQQVHSNYETDLFLPLIAAAARETGCTDLASPSLKVLADHVRACTFLIVDGVIASNEGRGYVLRRIIRRAVRHGYKLGARAAFFHRLVPDVVLLMANAYPELEHSQARVIELLRQEESRFFDTIEQGMGMLDTALAELDRNKAHVLSGDIAFKLHDTFGFPLDLTADICRERGVRVDQATFDQAMLQQKSQARAAGKFKSSGVLEYAGSPTEFLGYDTLNSTASVLALYKDGSLVDSLLAGDAGIVVLDQTPFYAESGGQVGDIGLLRGQLTQSQTTAHNDTQTLGATLFTVRDTQKIQANVFAHHGLLDAGRLSVGDQIEAAVDAHTRQRTVRHHSATHLLHKALREVLGEHVQQKGSLVAPDKTRFDFAHPNGLSQEEIRTIESIVNSEILANAASQAQLMAIDEAQQSGAMMLFGEKYGDVVRVLQIGSSKELCGGVHVNRSGDIGVFKIISETGVAAGVRRIEAVAGDVALGFIQEQQDTLSELARLCQTSVPNTPGKIAQMLANSKALEKELSSLKSSLASTQGQSLLTQVVEVQGISLLSTLLANADLSSLRETMDKVRDALGERPSVVVLASNAEGKASLIVRVSSALSSQIKANELANMLAQQVSGKGGGRAEMAQAGGTMPEKLPQALAAVKEWVLARAAPL
ncbi:MAG: alanine--tRNA ligase [Pseudomonadota bacterium]